MVRGTVLRLSIVAALVMGLTAAVACGTEPVGVETCRKIEFARCETAEACGIDLNYPTNRATTASKRVGECKRFYEDACLHGIAGAIDPGPPGADACVRAILDTPGCDVVKKPDIHPACSFLIPPIVIDSGTPEADADAAVDADDGGG